MSSSAIASGIDVGSTTCKAVVIDASGQVLASCVEPSDPRIEVQSKSMLGSLHAKIGAPKPLPLAATGYGRKRVSAAKVVTEITCHARGAFFLAGKGGLLIDIGGQDTKVIQISDGGQVTDFAMNDKCAAGTGRFLEVILKRLRVPYEEVAALADRAERGVRVSSTCTVFAESEVISRVASGEPIEGIVKGLHQALAARVVALAGTIPAGSALLMSGGVALNGAMVDALGEAVGSPIEVLPDPQLVGALGAALTLRAS